jgi:DNA-binding response OmpR family regulator
MGTKVLIIEDEEKIARFIELELGYEGYDTAKAFDAARGLRWPRPAGTTSSCWTSCCPA